MAGNKTLVTYATKGGITKEAASEIVTVLREKHKLKTDLVDLRKNPSPDIAQYGNIIVGSGVRMQRVYKEALKFLKENNFEGKKVALFLSSIEPRDEAIKKYIT